MSIRLDVTNFRNLRDVHLHDDSSLSLIVAYTEGGKSSLAGAIEYALTGSAFGLRGKDIEHLVTDGEQRMHVRLHVGFLTVNRTQSGGDALKGIAEQLAVPSEVLPLMFNAQMCGDGGSKAMRTFLDGVASSKFDALAHFQHDPVVHHCISQARKAGKMTTSQTIQYCEAMRAMCKMPAQPIAPSYANPTDDEIKLAADAVQSATKDLLAATKAYDELAPFPNQLVQIVHYKRELEAFTKLQAIAAMGDPLGQMRPVLLKLKSVNTKTLEALAEVLIEASPFSEFAKSAMNHLALMISDLESAILFAKSTLETNPAPPTSVTTPRLPDPETQKLYDDLAEANELTDIALSKLSRQALDARQEALDVKEKATKHLQLVQGVQADLLRRRGAWEGYERSIPEYESAKAKAEADWQMWDNASKAIAKAEIDHINKAGDVFGGLVSEFGEYLLQGRKIVVNRDSGISLGGRPIALLSASTRWRVEVCVMAAVARMMQSPLLVIDAADILDEPNKVKLMGFLLERVVPFFQHVVMTATCRARLEDEKPVNDARVTKWVLKNNELSKLAIAAAG